MTRRFCLTLDLKDDPLLIVEYKRYHEKVWPVPFVLFAYPPHAES